MNIPEPEKWCTCGSPEHNKPSPAPVDEVEKEILRIADDYAAPLDEGLLAFRIRSVVALARKGTL